MWHEFSFRCSYRVLVGKPEEKITFPHQPATGPYPEPGKLDPHHILFLHFNIIFSFMARSSN
jgi:hypothetical protein